MTKNLLFLIFIIFSYSANAQMWEAVNDSPFRSNHSINFSINGIGYSVNGNVNDIPSRQFYSYNPDTDLWSQLQNHPGPTRGFGIGDVWDGKAYIGFGIDINDNPLDDLWVYDPDASTWTELTSCPCTPRFHPTFVAHNGKIFMGMGGSANGNLNDWWEYDIASDSWSQKPDFPSLVRHHPYQFAVGDYVYAGLGHGNGPGLNIYDDWYRYDPVTEIWTEMASLPAEGRVAGTQFSFGDKGYVLSGDGDNHSYMDTGEFWEYDPALDTWTELPPHPGTSRWAPSSFIIDGYVYLMTGLSQSTVEDFQIWKYQLDADPPTSTVDLSENELLISPIPSNDFITVKLKETNSSIKNISLLNLKGQLILEQQGINNNSITINIHDLPVGVYYVKVEMEEEVITQKIVKQ